MSRVGVVNVLLFRRTTFTIMIHIVASVGGNTEVVETTETERTVDITKMEKGKVIETDGICVKLLDVAEY